MALILEQIDAVMPVSYTHLFTKKINHCTISQKYRYEARFADRKYREKLSGSRAGIWIKLCVNSEYAPEYLNEAAEQYAEAWQIDETIFVHGKMCIRDRCMIVALINGYIKVRM